jgi:predicted dehydrogenase
MSIRLAILGCGGMAAEHVRRIKKRNESENDVEIVALCDVNPDALKEWRDKNIGEQATPAQIFTDAATMYAEGKPDAVIINTPHTLHFEHGKQALEAGLHVLMEKPMVTNSDDAKKLAEIAEQSGKVFSVGFNTSCMPEFQWLRDTAQAGENGGGEYGKLQLITGWLSQNWKKNSVGKWRQDPALSGGGEMYDSGAHLFNSLVFVVGQPIAEVHAFVDNSGTAVDINGSVNLRFANGVFATVTIAGDCTENGTNMNLFFERGRAEIDPCGWSNNPIKLWKNGQYVRYPKIEGEPVTPTQNFFEVIQGRDHVRATAQNGIVHSQIMDAIYESARLGQAVKVQ